VRTPKSLETTHGDLTRLCLKTPPHTLDVTPRAEALAGAGQDDDAHVSIAANAIQLLDQSVLKLVINRISGIRTVQTEGRNHTV
jgi:hypothetical protein